MSKIPPITAGLVFGLLASVAVGSGCRGQLEGMAPGSVARQGLSQSVRRAFGDAELLQREGNDSEAKKARLRLAKAVAAKANLPWPPSLSDALAADLIWAAHTLPPAERGSGIRGLREYFSRYTRSERPELRDFKKALGSNLARELLRRGVCGDEQALLDAIGSHSRERTPRLMLADFLDEHERYASGETLRLRAEQEGLPALRENLSRLEEIRVRLEAIAEKALQEWRESDLSVRLATVGRFNSLADNGLPVLTPLSRAALLSSTAEQQRWIPALNLARGGWTGLEIERLTRLDLIHVTSLSLGQNQIGAEGARYLADKSSPFKNVTSLNLDGNRIDAEGLSYLASKDSPFGNVTLLNLYYNAIDAEGAGHLAGKDSSFKNVTSLFLGNNRIGPVGAGRLAGKDSPFKNVTLLSLYNNELGAEGARHLAGKDSPFKNVTSLFLGGNELGAEGVRHLTGKDSPFENVTSLSLVYNGIDAEGASYLAGKDSPFKNVTSLRLGGNGIDAEGARHLAGKDSPFKDVTSLSLSNNWIDAEGAGYLAGKDSPFKNVISLELGQNQIGSAGASHLAGKDSAFKDVSTLFLEYNLIGTEGAAHFMGPASPLRRLKKVGLVGNDIPQEVIDSISRSLTERRD